MNEPKQASGWRLKRGVAVIAASCMTLGMAATVTAKSTGSAPIARVRTDGARVPGKYPKAMVAPGQRRFDGSFVETVGYRSADGKGVVKIWESGPGVLRTTGYPYDEYCLVLEGLLEVTNSDGSRAAYRAGDSFVIPKGWRGTWNMKSRFKKQYIALTSPD